MKLLRRLFCFILILNFFSACSPLKKLANNEYLVNKNVITTHNRLLTDELYPIIKQKPNRKLLGLFRFHLIVYNFANSWKRDSSKFKNWLKYTVGETPVTYDSTLTEITREQIQLFVQNKGFFDAKVTDTVVVKRKRLVNVYYRVMEGKPYVLDSVSYTSKDEVLLYHVLSEKKDSKLHIGDNFNLPSLQSERERITDNLKNSGYYNFSREYIHFEADSSGKDHKISLNVNIDRVREGDTIRKPDNHKVYDVGKVFIQTNYTGNVDSLKTDTLQNNGYNYVYSSKLKLNPNILQQTIFVKEGDLYQQKKVDDTYQRLGSLGIFRFINIRFIEDMNNKLNCLIQLTTLPKHSFSIENDLTHNNNGNLGMEEI